MPRIRTALAVFTAGAALALTGCATAATPAAGGSDDAASTAGFPVTIPNAFGETEITSQPKRVVTVDWGNQEAALALGVVPVAMPKVTWGDEDGDGLLPWVKDKLDELGAETPTLMDETDGYDYEAIADAQPDVILAAYSGMTKDQYETLSKIAPVVTYADVAWGTTWQDMTLTNAKALGLESEAETLVSGLEEHVTDVLSAYPVAGKKTLFTSFDPTDMSTLGFYSLQDPRAAFLTEAGLSPAQAVETASKDSETFWFTQSTENIEDFADLQVIVGYGGDDTLAAMQADPLWSRIPAVASGAVAVLGSDSTLAAAANPSPLNIGSSYGDDYLRVLGEAVAKSAS